MDVKDKVVIVTGASSGIGKASAKLLAKNGAKVVLAARSKEKLEKLSEELSGSFVVPADMTKEKEVKEMVKKTMEHFGRVDILINNAGRGYDASTEEINIETFRKIFELDVVGLLVAMQEVMPVMRRQKGGTIINISSGTALMSLPNMGAYSSLKRAVVGLSLTAREELKKDNIAVSVVYPYITLTDFEKNTVKEKTGTIDFEDGDEGGFNPPDSAEYIAQKILDGIKTGKAEIFAHEWMKNMH